MKKLSVLLVCSLLLALLPGCSGNADSSAPENSSAASPAEENNAASDNGYTPSGEELLHITVPSAEVTLDELKENDYMVILTVGLDKNPGITTSQWGLKFDNRCSVVAENENMIIGTVCAVNDESHFLWTAWGGQGTDSTGGILMLGVTLPENAAPGDTYSLTYADTSAVGGAHQWKNLNSDYVEMDAVGWTNGVITVVE